MARGVRPGCASSPGVDPAALRRAIGEYAGWWWSEAERHRRGRLDLRAATREIVAEALKRCGCEDEALAGEIASHYRDLREERSALFPEAIAVIERLREAGVRLGMMTNGAAAAQRAKIERFGLARHFEHIVIEGELGVGKPDRLVFETLLSELAVKPAETWAVGDNLEFDVLAPMELGIFGVWIDAADRGCDGERRPDRIIAALSQLLE